MGIYAQETWVDATRDRMIDQSEVYETFADAPGDLYRSSMREYGRCVGYVYIGDGIPVGWVFRQRQRYQDARSDADTYIRETWVNAYRYGAPLNVKTGRPLVEHVCEECGAPAITNCGGMPGVFVHVDEHGFEDEDAGADHTCIGVPVRTLRPVEG